LRGEDWSSPFRVFVRSPDAHNTLKRLAEKEASELTIIYDSPSSCARQGEQAKDLPSMIQRRLGIDKKVQAYSIIWPLQRKVRDPTSDAWSLLHEATKSILVVCMYDHPNLTQRLYASRTVLGHPDHAGIGPDELREMMRNLRTQMYLADVVLQESCNMHGKPSKKHWAYPQWLAHSQAMRN